MNHKSQRFLWIVGLLIIFILPACKTNKQLSIANLPKVDTAKAFDYNTYVSTAVLFKTFSGKASIHVDFPNFNQSFTSKIKIESDKDIWLNAALFGIEGGQGFITQDSVQAFLRLGKKAMKTSFADGVKLLNAPLDYQMFQNLIIGNPILNTEKNTVGTDKDSLVEVVTTYGDNVQTLLYNKILGLLTWQTVINKAKDFYCLVTYADYSSVNGQRFANKRFITIVNHGDTATIDLKFSKADIDQPVEILFNIPENYNLQSTF